MNVNLGNDLARTLSAAATAAQEPEGDFAAGVARRRRHHQRVRVVGLAWVAAVVVAVSGTTAAVGLRGAPGATGSGASPSATGGASPSPTGSASPSPTGGASAPANNAAGSSIDLSKVPAADQVWPDAVVTVPATLPDGRGMAHWEFLDSERLLVVPGTNARKYHLPVVYNLGTGQMQELLAKRTGYSYAGVSIGDRSILMIVSLDGSDDVRELWAAPKAGGPAVKRATFSGQPNGVLSTVTSAFEVDDALFVSFDEPDPGGHDEVHRVRADGTTEKVPGTDGWRTGWPTPPPWLIQSPGVENGGQGAFWNVGTGERRTPRPLDGLDLIECTAQACASRDRDDSVVTYRWDGKGQQLRATGLPSRDASSLDVLFDASGRFAQVRTATVSYLWDLLTNKAGWIDSTMAFEDGTIPLGEPVGGRRRVISTVRIP